MAERNEKKKNFGTEPKIGYCPLSMRLGAGAQAWVGVQGAAGRAGRWALGAGARATGGGGAQALGRQARGRASKRAAGRAGTRLGERACG